MAEEVLSDALVNDLPNQIDVSVSPVNHFVFDLGFDSPSGSEAQELAIQKQHPQVKYEYLLQKFVATHGRGEEAAQYLIDRFKVKEKKDLVNFLEEAIKKQNVPKQSGCRQEPGPAEGHGQTETESRPLNAGANARNKSFRKFEAGLCLVVALLAIVVACSNLSTVIPEYIGETFSLEECQDALRSHYERHLFKMYIKPWDPYDDMDLEKLYTTLSLYKEHKNTIPYTPFQKSTLNGSVNDIFQTKVYGSLPERIVLFGEAGQGKTTAVAKMAYDWANKKEYSPLKNVKLLFVFKMRNMNSTTEITEAIVQMLGRKYKKYKIQLEDYINSHEKDIVMLFDGYDEFSGKLHCRKNVGDVIDILCQERCRRCHVLVTSRPSRKEDFYSRNVYYSKMVIEGYSQQHATDFIDKFFRSDETKGRELKKYLEEDIVTNEMISTPLFCTMVCYLWNEGYIHGNFTRTKLFGVIMEFLRTHLNAKDKRNIGIKQDLLDDTVVSVGQVAFTKLSNKNDLNPFMLNEDDFSEVHDDKVSISYSLGLLTKSMKAESDIIIHIEFFHKLAQEYSAGRYLARGLDDGRAITIDFPDGFDGLIEVFQFASGTSVLACRKVLAYLTNVVKYSSFSSRCYLYHPIIMNFISEGGTCAEDSETYLTHFFRDGKLQLRQVTASTVVGFEKLPGSVKKKITTIDISGTADSPHLFERLWNSMRTCIHLTHLEMYRNLPLTISPQMEPLYSVKSFTTALQPPADDYVQIMMFLPNIRELIISCYDFGDLSEFSLTPDVFGKLWDQFNTSSLLSRLVLPIPADIRFNLKHLTSIRVFETYPVMSVSSLAHVLTFLPKVRELIIQEKELVEMDYNTEAFCELWKNLHTSPNLTRVILPIPAYIPCDLEPLQSVQVLETKSSSIHLRIVLINLPNLQKLLLHSDIPGYPEVDVKSAHEFFVDFWKVLHKLCKLGHFRMNVPKSIPSLLLEPLRSVHTFQTKIKSHMEVFPILLSQLPNISKLDVFATNNYDRKIAEDTYYNKVVSAIIDGVVKNGVQLEVFNMTFDPRRDASKTVSRDSVKKILRMLKTNGKMQQLEIISFNYCVFNESDLIEIITTITEFTAIMLLRIDCSLDSEGELFRFAIQRDQPQDENKEPNQSKQSGSLMLTLFSTDPETNLKTEETFVLPRSQ